MCKRWEVGTFAHLVSFYIFGLCVPMISDVSCITAITSCQSRSLILILFFDNFDWNSRSNLWNFPVSYMFEIVVSLVFGEVLVNVLPKDREFGFGVKKIYNDSLWTATSRLQGPHFHIGLQSKQAIMNRSIWWDYSLRFVNHCGHKKPGVHWTEHIALTWNMTRPTTRRQQLPAAHRGPRATRRRMRSRTRPPVKTFGWTLRGWHTIAQSSLLSDFSVD